MRPIPVCTSSKTSIASNSSASARAVSSVSCESGRTPPSPWIGSRKIAAVSGADAPRPSVSGVAKRAPGTSGSNGARFAGWPVIESAPIVRPWKEPSSATSSVRPVALRAHLIAASTASVPELQ